MSLFKSTKFWTAVSGVVAVVLAQLFGVAEETTMQITGIIMTLLLGQGLADFGKKANTPPK